MLESMLNAFRAPDIRRRLLFVAFILIVYRALAHVLIPGINPQLSTHSGGGQQLLRAAVALLRRRRPADVDRRPGAEPVHQRHDHHADPADDDPVPAGALRARASTAATRSPATRAGCRCRWPRSRRTASWPSCRQTSAAGHHRLHDAVQLREPTSPGRRSSPSPPARFVLMWLGELITEKGIGNGISFIIFAGIVSRVPGDRRHVPAAAPTGWSCSSSASSAS